MCYMLIIVIITSLTMDTRAFSSMTVVLTCLILCVGDIIMKTLNKQEATPSGTDVCSVMTDW